MCLCVLNTLFYLISQQLCLRECLDYLHFVGETQSPGCFGEEITSGFQFRRHWGLGQVLGLQ